MNNGRVNLFGPTSAGGAIGNNNGQGDIPGFGFEKSSEVQFQDDMLRGNWEKNELSTGFFSQANLTRIQTSLRKEVYERSQPKGYVIDNQSVDEMKMIMRGIFYQYARNQPDNIQSQIEELNRRVLDWSIPHILSAVDHYLYYLKDVDTLPVPIAHPAHLSSAGTRTKPLGPFM